MTDAITLELHNVGNIRDARIEIDGITILTGVNRTGKSTVLKTIYSVLEASRDLESRRRGESSDLAMKLLSGIDPGCIGADGAKTLDDLIARLDGIEDRMSEYNRALFEDMKEAYMDGSYGRFHTLMVDKCIRSEFQSPDQFSRRRDGNAEAILTYHGTRRRLTMSRGDVQWEGEFLDLPLPVYYDTPFVIDGPYGGSAVDHRSCLGRMLIAPGDTNVFVTKASSNRQRTIEEQISEVLPGRIVVKNNIIVYIEPDGLELGMPNIASGMKLFAMIWLLVSNGRLNGDSVLLLDEPEVHLHPKWINILARLVCILADGGVKVLMTTHSPQLLMAIEGLSRDRGIGTRFYVMSRKDGVSVEEDVSGDPTPAYIDMSDAVDEAGAMYWSDGHDDRSHRQISEQHPRHGRLVRGQVLGSKGHQRMGHGCHGQRHVQRGIVPQERRFDTHRP